MDVRRLMGWLAAVLLLLPAGAWAAGVAQWVMVPQLLRPGQEQALYYSVP